MDPKNITHIIEGVPVGSIANKDGKPSAVSFFHDNNRFYAEIMPDKLILFRDSEKSHIAYYDFSNEVLTWALDGACKDREVADELWTRKLLIAHGEYYSKELVEVMRTGITDYLTRLSNTYK